MNFIFECSYSKLAMEYKIETKDTKNIYGIALTWLELSRALYKAINLKRKHDVIFFISDHILNSCDFFNKLSPHGFYFEKISSLTDSSFCIPPLVNHRNPPPLSLNSKDLLFIKFFNQGLSMKEISLKLNTGIKNIYNQKSALLERLGLPNEHILYLLLPFILTILDGNHIHHNP